MDNFTHIEGKASVVELRGGDLLLRGVAANYNVDLEDEAFAPGAFKAAIGKFLGSGNSPLCFHHRTDVVLGKVTALEEKAGVGLVMEAIMTKQPESSPHYWIYEGVKRGVLRGLSVAGIFKRAGNKIVSAALTEISVTGRPIGDTTFDVTPYEEDAQIASAKALVMRELEDELNRRLDLVDLQLAVAQIRQTSRATRSSAYRRR